MDRPATVVLVEDNRPDVRLIEEMIAETAFGRTLQLEPVTRCRDAVARVRDGDVDAVLCDLGLPDSSGLDTLVRLRAADPLLPIVVLTGHDESMAMQSLQAGAQDYLTKGRFDADLLARCLRYAMERQALLNRLDERRRVTRRAREQRLFEMLDTSGRALGGRWATHRLLRDRAPQVFDDLVVRYATVLVPDTRLGGEAEDTEMAVVADHLTAFNADARDAIAIHQEAVARLTARDEHTGTGDEALSPLVDLLALLVTRYRDYAWSAESEEQAS